MAQSRFTGSNGFEYRLNISEIVSVVRNDAYEVTREVNSTKENLPEAKSNCNYIFPIKIEILMNFQSGLFENTKPFISGVMISVATVARGFDNHVQLVNILVYLPRLVNIKMCT